MRDNSIDSIIAGQDIRESLIDLKNDLSDNDELRNEQLYDALKHLLKDENPKIRANSAIVLGHFRKSTVKNILLQGYYDEIIDYAKVGYLKGLSYQNCKPVIDELKDIQSTLTNSTDVDKKHVQAQLKILNPLVRSYASHKKKMVRLLHKDVDVILTTLPYYQFTLFDYVKKYKYKPVARGVLVRTNSVYDLLSIRNYREMIIPLRRCTKMNKNADEIVSCLAQSNLMDLLDNLFDSTGSFYYKLSDRSRNADSSLTTHIIKGLLDVFPNKLLNVTRNYEIEIILEEVRDEKLNAYLILSILDNPRFDYRKEIISNSMQPFVAATILETAKNYMKPYAKVLDPFCGSGITLIERCLMKPTRFALGIDVYGKGLDAAKRNSKAANVNIHYINKNALRFVNSEMFDEIVTDMPTLAQMKDKDELTHLYDSFFRRIHRHVASGGYCFIYTSEIQLVQKNLRLNHDYLTLLDHYDVPRGRKMHYFFIIQVR
ncbi:MAG: methyltransferase [Erysipelotrichaceae bacterium]|nr:methyltransferase [Erysipelotrichaceae bacterium]